MKTIDALTERLGERDRAFRERWEAGAPARLVRRDIVAARVGLKMEIAEVAERAGLSEGTVLAIEAGWSDPKMSTLLKVCAALGLSLRCAKGRKAGAKR